MVTESVLREFSASMPPAYLRAFSAREIEDHARVALNRGSRPAHVDWCAGTDRGAGIVLCVVADDRPGLLATICAALLHHDFEVIRAQAYTRCLPGSVAHAVDFFWVREHRPSGAGALASPPVAELNHTLNLLLEGRMDAGDIARTRASKAAPSALQTRVRFIDGAEGELAILEVETGDRKGLLLSLAQALYSQNVNITRAEVRTEEGRVMDRFMITEIDGGPIGSTRRLQLQVAVLAAIQPHRELSAPDFESGIAWFGVRARAGKARMVGSSG